MRLTITSDLSDFVKNPYPGAGVSIEGRKTILLTCYEGAYFSD